MDKLQLDLDDLKVDSFQTDPQEEAREGTVHGNSIFTCNELKDTCGLDCSYAVTCGAACRRTRDNWTCNPWC